MNLLEYLQHKHHTSTDHKEQTSSELHSIMKFREKSLLLENTSINECIEGIIAFHKGCKELGEWEIENIRPDCTILKNTINDNLYEILITKDRAKFYLDIASLNPIPQINFEPV